MPFLSDGFYIAIRLSRARDRLLSRSSLDCVGEMAATNSVRTGDGVGAKYVVSRAILAFTI